MKTTLGIKGLALTEYAISGNAILGIRDSGKTWAGCEVAEELFDASVPSICFDPIGKWHSLRVPGKGKGYPFVVAGGRFGDLPLTRKNAGDLVRGAMVDGISLVLDLFSREMTKADWRYIVQQSMEILLFENEDHGLRHVFIEEAGEFVPQRVIDGATFNAVEKVVRMGGNSKLGCTLIHQRPADINKSVLELCANVILLKQSGKNTVTDLKKWAQLIAPDQAAKIGSTLPHLKPGSGWAFIAGIPTPFQFQVPARNSKHPDRREDAKASGAAAPRAAVPATKFVEAMKAKLEEKLKPAVRQAPRDLSSSPIALEIKAEHLAAAEERGRQVGLGQGYTQALDDLQPFIASQQNTIMEAVSIIGAVDRMDRHLREQISTMRKKSPAQRRPSNSPSSTMKAPTKPRAAASAPPDGISKPQAKILESLVWWAAMGQAKPTRVQVGIKAKMKARGGHFKTRVSELSGMGLISYDGADRMLLTPAGVAVAPEPKMGETVLDSLRPLLSNPQGKILQAMVDGFTDRVAIAEAAAMDAAGGHFKTRLSELSSFGIIDYPDKASAVLQEWVMEQ